MPRLTYKPGGTTPQVFDIDYDKLMSPERIAIERLAEMTWGEVKEAFVKESTPVIHAFLYVMLKRQEPTMTSDQLQFCGEDVEVGTTDTEAQRTLAHFTDHPEEITPEVAKVLPELRAQVGDIEPDPKETTTSSD